MAGEVTGLPVTRGARGAGTALTVGLGMAVAVQARINGELGSRLDDGFAAALLSFLGGLLLLVVLAVTRRELRRGLRRVGTALRARQPPADRRQPATQPDRLRPYHLLGGSFGAFLVATQGLTVTTIGVAVFTIAVVAGQTISSLLVDRVGVGPGEPRAVTVPRVTGAVLALAAVVLAVSDRLGGSAGWWLALLPALAGVGIAWQQAVNGRVGAAARGSGSPLAGMLPAALVNFTAGTATLLLIVAVEAALRGLPDPLPTQPWLYLGGPLGVLFIGAAAAVVPVTGVLLLGLGSVAGQLIGALLLDLFLPVGDGRLITASAVAGTGLALLAVIVIALPGRRR